jgi:cytochrome c oxidase subunit III
MADPHTAEPHLAHHFHSAQQQFDAGKLGIWLFLLTEVLFFSGLFCAYAVYRSAHPEIFNYAHYFLDARLGALNTCVLLLSSLTAALCVRFAQLGQQRLLALNICITIVCAFAFLGVKYVEYSHKFEDGLLPGVHFNPSEHVWETRAFKLQHPEASAYAERLRTFAAKGKAEDVVAHDRLVQPTRLELEPLLKAGVLGPKAEYPEFPSQPHNAHVFFGIYFMMTGLHGIHVLGGIGVWIWLLVRARRGEFSAKYFGPIDYAALYWHLVDLIWIYLFPLLYLIH